MATEKRMESNVSTDLSKEAPYWDDFLTVDSEGKTPRDKNFLRILFKPGTSIQARELNQMQTALQDQIDKFGRHVFRNDGPVLGGEFTMDNALQTINLTSLQNDYNTANRIEENLVGTEIGNDSTFSDSTVKAFVVGAQAIPDSNTIKVFVRYSKTNETGTHTVDAAGERDPDAGITFTRRFADNDTLYTSENIQIGTASSTGSAARLTVEEGIFFTKGSFVFKEKEEIFINLPALDDGFVKYSGQPILEVVQQRFSAVGGAELIQDIELYDNSAKQNIGDSANLGAPGADRYSIALNLKLLTDDPLIRGDGENVNLTQSLQEFSGDSIKLLDVVNNQPGGYNSSQYNTIGDFIEIRTSEESGNYTLNPFRIRVREHLNDGANNGGKFTSGQGGDITKYVLEIDPSTAYIQGRRIQFAQKSLVTGNKPRTVEYNDASVGELVRFQARKGNYIEGVSMTGLPNSSTTYGLFLSKTGSESTLEFTSYSNSPNSGNRIGTLKVSTVDYNGVVYRAYVNTIVMQPGFAISDAKYLAPDQLVNGTDFSLDAGDSGTGFILRDVQDNSDVYFTGKFGVSGVALLEYVERAQVSGSITNAGAQTLSLTSGEFISDNPNDYIVVDNDGTVFPLDPNKGVEISGTDFNTATFHLSTYPVSGQNVVVICPRKIIGGTATHTVNALSISGQSTGGVANGGKIDLTQNIFRITSITDASNDTVITRDFEIDRRETTESTTAGTRLIYRGSGTAPANINITGTQIIYGSGVAHIGSYKLPDPFEGHSSGTITVNPSEIHTEPEGNFSLADAVDFRNLSGTLDPNSLVEMKINYIYPRIDTLVLDKEGNFKLIQGIPAEFPEHAEIETSVLKIADIYLPPFIDDIDEIQLNPIHTRRYTMSDINSLETRVRNLEYYTALNRLEQEAVNKQIVDDNGLKFRNGILTDAFTGHGVGNPFDGGYKCAVDDRINVLRPSYSSENLKLQPKRADDKARQPNDSFAGNTRSAEPNSRLPATERFNVISQPYASVSVNVNPYAISAYIGDIELSPSSDEWKSTKTLPNVIVNNDANYDALLGALKESDALGTVWGEWQSHWTGSYQYQYRVTHKKKAWHGKTKSSYTYHQATVKTGYKTRVGEETFIKTGVHEEEIGNNLVDISYIPFVRSRRVYFRATNLKPNSRHIPYLDDVDITKYTVGVGVNGGDSLYTANLYPDQFANNNFDPNDQGVEVGVGTAVPAPTPIITDGAGTTSGYFVIPNNDALKFQCGTLQFKLIDSANPDINTGDSYGVVEYKAVGTIETTQKHILSTKTAELATRAVDDTSYGWRYDKKEGREYRDPIAQSFIIGGYESGLFVSDIDLFFDTKDPNIPVNIYIVTMDNGHPTQDIVPYSRVFKNPADVGVSTDASLATNFKFESPVYLQPGAEYAIVVASNATGDGEDTAGGVSTGYKMWVAEVGGQDVTAGPGGGEAGDRTIKKNPYAGVFFKSQNASTYTEDQNIDFKFTLRAYKFFDSEQVTNTKQQYEYAVILPKNAAGTVQTGFNACTLYPLSTELNLPGVSVTYNIQAGDESYDVKANQEINLENQLTINQTSSGDTTASVIVRATLTSENEYLTPMINLDRFSLLAFDNKITSLQVVGTGTDEELNKYHGDSCTARYITKFVGLANSSTALDVYAKIQRPTSTEIRAYARFASGTAANDSPSGDDFSYVRLDSDKIPFNDTGEFAEVHFRKDFFIDASANNSPNVATSEIKFFNDFQIKLCMGSSNPAKVPLIKDLRAIATA
tara:strand:- start:3043 stop:8334 length:5292 start_codon:yes stop_codon:yes gene_type:complete